jgi:hypothetical protein
MRVGGKPYALVALTLGKRASGTHCICSRMGPKNGQVALWSEDKPVAPARRRTTVTIGRPARGLVTPLTTLSRLY